MTNDKVKNAFDLSRSNGSVFKVWLKETIVSSFVIRQ